MFEAFEEHRNQSLCSLNLALASASSPNRCAFPEKGLGSKWNLYNTCQQSAPAASCWIIHGETTTKAWGQIIWNMSFRWVASWHWITPAQYTKRPTRKRTALHGPNLDDPCQSSWNLPRKSESWRRSIEKTQQMPRMERSKTAILNMRCNYRSHTIAPPDLQSVSRWERIFVETKRLAFYNGKMYI